MTRRSVTLTGVVWWAMLAAVVVALTPLTHRGPAWAEEEPDGLDTFVHCSPEQIANTGANCDNPKSCINACAAKCNDETGCRRCCAQFSSNQTAMEQCLGLCKMGYNSTPEP